MKRKGEIRRNHKEQILRNGRKRETARGLREDNCPFIGRTHGVDGRGINNKPKLPAQMTRTLLSPSQLVAGSIPDQSDDQFVPRTASFLLSFLLFLSSFGAIGMTLAEKVPLSNLKKTSSIEKFFDLLYSLSLAFAKV